MNAADSEGMTEPQRQLAEQWAGLIPWSMDHFGNLVEGLDDAEARSAIGLAICLAARAFDPERGARFSTFAIRCIRNQLLNDVKTASRLPLHRLGPVRVQSLDAQEDGHGENSALAVEQDPAGEMQSADSAALLTKALELLSPRRAEVFRRCGLDEEDPHEVAAELGISRTRVKQLLQSARKDLADVLMVDNSGSLKLRRAASD